MRKVAVEVVGSGCIGSSCAANSCGGDGVAASSYCSYNPQIQGTAKSRHEELGNSKSRPSDSTMNLENADRKLLKLRRGAMGTGNIGSGNCRCLCRCRCSGRCRWCCRFSLGVVVVVVGVVAVVLVVVVVAGVVAGGWRPLRGIPQAAGAAFA